MVNVNVQLLGPAGREPLARVTDVAVLVTTPPLHWGDVGVPETVNPVGSVSVRLIPVNAPPVAGFVIVIVTILFCPATIGLVPNDFATLTVVTETLAEAGAEFVPPSAVTILFVGMVLV